MREILYRGKRKDNREWVYGGYMKNIHHNTTAIWFEQDDGTSYGYEVIQETAGQYTGLKDRNDVKVFEGDILRSENWNVHCCGEFCGEECDVKYWDTIRYEVFYDLGSASFKLRADLGKQKNEIRGNGNRKGHTCIGITSYRLKKERMIVIGNIHDNPELLDRIER
jgi:uncharacterized phage protein (TIGR01671 family)